MDPQKFKFQIFAIIFLATLVAGTAGITLVEDLSPFDAIYFSIVTMATVGYGDIHPVTPLGKIFAILMIFGGVGTFLGVVASAVEMLINRQERKIRMQKLNMVLGLFFSEIGNRLLKYLSEMDASREHKRNNLIINNDWTEKDFLNAHSFLRTHEYEVTTQIETLLAVSNFIKDKGNFLLRLLENPILLENEAFTELLRAIFHLRDEFLHRPDLTQLPETDYAHLAVDMKRIYGLLVWEWINYMKYLKSNYPYLFFLATRTNPFDPAATPIIH